MHNMNPKNGLHLRCRDNSVGRAFSLHTGGHELKIQLFPHFDK